MPYNRYPRETLVTCEYCPSKVHLLPGISHSDMISDLAKVGWTFHPRHGILCPKCLIDVTKPITRFLELPLREGKTLDSAL